MTKGSGCCCSPCETNASGVNLSGVCCKCMPKRICVSVYTPAGADCPCGTPPEGDPYGPVITIKMSFVCDVPNGVGFTTGGGYTGFFMCGNVKVDLTFSPERDANGDCWFYLASSRLGYVNGPFLGTGPYDTRLRLPMGGPYHDDMDLRREQCASPDFDFTVDMSGASSACGTALIQVRPADYMSRSRAQRNWVPAPDCWVECVCLTLTTGGVEYTVQTCWDASIRGWRGTFVTGPDSFVSATVFRDSAPGDPTVLHLESDLGNGAPLAATCDCHRGMLAEWDLSGPIIGIAGNLAVGCADCKCWCRCVCIVYSDSHNAGVAQACWDEYTQGWGAEFTFGDPVPESATVGIGFDCNPRTGETKLKLATDVGVVLDTSANPVSISCPDIAASWDVLKPDGDTARISIQCDECGQCKNLINAPCCPRPIPIVLMATVTGTVRILDCADCVERTYPCVGGSFPLAFDAAGTGAGPIWAGHGPLPCNIVDDPSFSLIDFSCLVLSLQLYCGESLDTLLFKVSNPSGDSSFEPAPMAPYGSCDPVHAVTENIHIICAIPLPPPCVITFGPYNIYGNPVSIFIDIIITITE